MTHRTNEYGQPIGIPLPGWTPPVRPGRQPIEGRYCRIEPIGERYLADLHRAHAGNAQSWTYLPYGPFATEAEYRGWALDTCFGDDPMFHVVVAADSGRPSGVAAYLRINPPSGSIEVGHIHYSPGLKRSAAATEAMYLLMKRAFDLGYRRYEWKCDAFNAPSRAAAQRLGFSFEGVFRQATVYKGRNRDTAWYAVIDQEWPALARAYRAWLDPANFDESGRQRSRLSDLTRPLLFRRDGNGNFDESETDSRSRV